MMGIMALTWKDDDELFDLVRTHLYTAVVGDVMDTLGFRHQFLPQQIQPLRKEMFVAGRCMTVLEADIFDADSTAKRPFGLMLEALDDLKKNEVYICTGGSLRYAFWGELMSMRAIHCRAAGAVVNGFSRDTRGILDLGFPTFSRGRYAQDQAPRGKVIDFRVPIEIGGVSIQPGDIVVGDIDGVCIIPRAIENDVVRKAYEKATGEKTVAKAIAGGMSTAEAFDTYGIM